MTSTTTATDRSLALARIECRRYATRPAFLVGTALCVAALWWFARGHLRDFRLALGGMVVLLGFVIVRATSFHDMDSLIRESVGGVTLNAVLELGGIALVAVAAGTISDSSSAGVEGSR